MTKPLALVYYERIMPGSQLPNRLQDLGYRVCQVAQADAIIDTARKEKPMIAIVDLVTDRTDICAVLGKMLEDLDTAHIPIIGFAGQKHTKLRNEAEDAGVTLVALDDALLPQLPHLLEHALQID